MEVSSDVHNQLILPDHINYLKKELSIQKTLERKVIKEMNTIIPLEEAADWRERRKAPKKKATGSLEKKKQKNKEIESDSEDDAIDVDDIEAQDDETDFAVPRCVNQSPKSPSPSFLM